jgi:hypothetical protein
MKKGVGTEHGSIYTSAVETTSTCDSTLSAVKLLNVKSWDLALQHNLRGECWHKCHGVNCGLRNVSRFKKKKTISLFRCVFWIKYLRTLLFQTFLSRMTSALNTVKYSPSISLALVEIIVHNFSVKIWRKGTLPCLPWNLEKVMREYGLDILTKRRRLL